mmetsp:Transcript_35699/g.78187  ORF Transcript_35699/g.78187 Transcript_35699/m.78187 type:complete len:121 (+) Transcript_35699:49-411(+)
MPQKHESRQSHQIHESRVDGSAQQSRTQLVTEEFVSECVEVAKLAALRQQIAKNNLARSLVEHEEAQREHDQAQRYLLHVFKGILVSSAPPVRSFVKEKVREILQSSSATCPNRMLYLSL